MRNRILMILAVCAAPLGLAVVGDQAQGLSGDRVTVTLPYSVRVGDTVLPPATYEFLRRSENVVQIMKNPNDPKQMEVDAMVFTVPIEAQNVASSTRLVLEQYGNQYYLDKVWIAGMSTGYEFALPDNVKALEREQRASHSPASKEHANKAG